MDEIKLTCINCPLGCALVVKKVDGEYQVSGNNCLRGKKYAISEITNPVRIVTTTVKVKNSKERLSVKSNGGIVKDKIFTVIKTLKNVEVTAPIKIGDVVVKNIIDSGVDIVATKTIEGDEQCG